MQRPKSPNGSSAGVLICQDPEIVDRRPQLAEYLTCEKWDDGKARTTSSLAITVVADMINVALNDRDLKRSLYVTAVTLEEALDAIEKALGEQGQDWRLWKAGTRR